MSLIEPYLQHLSEGRDERDSSMPNPYDFQSLELDPKVTKQDLNMLGKQLEKMKKHRDPGAITDPFLWLYFETDYEKWYGKNPTISQSDANPFVIIDKGKRVGIVSISDPMLVWASWVPGHNYAGRGIMKMLEKIVTEKEKPKWKRVFTTIYKKNIPSLKTAIFLKMKITKSGDKYWGELSYPFWFIEKKKGFFRR